MRDRVLCAVTNIYIEDKIVIIPLIDHIHSDLESGQDYKHYHVDTRYNGYQDLSKYYVDYPGIRIREGQFKLDWFMLIKYSEKYKAITSKKLIRACKLSGDRLINNRCVHKGFDLSEIEPVNGVITCPLHELKYSVKTKKLVKQ